MNNPNTNPAHRVVLAAFSGAMTQEREAERTAQAPVEQVLAQLEDWALGDAGLGLGPCTPVSEEGHTLAGALVAGGWVSHAGWLSGWMGRHGAASVFAPTAPNPLEALMDRILDRDAQGEGGPDFATACVVEVLLGQAPDTALDGHALARWRDGLVLARQAGMARGTGPSEVSMLLAGALERRRMGLLGAGQDGLAGRGPERWLGPKVLEAMAGKGRDEQVLGPSGTWRGLGEWARVRQDVARPAGWRTGSPDALPTLAMRDARAGPVAWVLEREDGQGMRERAWKLAVDAPVAFANLLGVMDPEGEAWVDQATADRVKAALCLRDRQGRTPAGLLACTPLLDGGRTSTRLPRFFQAQVDQARARRDALAVLDHPLLSMAAAAGVCRAQDLAGGGAWVVEATMAGWSDDPFTGWVRLAHLEGHPGAMEWLAGPGGLKPGIVEALIDGLVVCQGEAPARMGLVVALLERGEQAEQARRVEEAALWGRACGGLLRDMRERMGDITGDTRAAIVGLGKHVAAHGVLLAMGQAEWRQWGHLGLEDAWEHVAGTEPDLDRALEVVQAGLAARELKMVLPGAPPGQGRLRM